MDQSISIKASEIKYLISGYQFRIGEIDTLLRDLEGERKEIEKKIIILNKPTSPDTYIPGIILSDDINYNKNAPWFSKAKYILQRANQPLTTTEIVNSILLYEPELTRLPVTKSVSSILGAKSNEGKELERIVTKGKGQKFTLK